jgi:hypothetical protein
VTSVTIGTIDGQREVIESSVSNSAGGDITLVPPAPTLITRIYRLALVVAGATSLTFKDGANLLSGAMALTANGSIVLDLSGLPWYKTSPGNAMIVNSSNAVLVAGTVWYTQTNQAN